MLYGPAQLRPSDDAVIFLHVTPRLTSRSQGVVGKSIRRKGKQGEGA